MKYKYVKIAADTVTTPLTGASTEGTADASALSRIKGILTGDTEKDMFDKAISHFKEKSKQEQFQGAEDLTNVGNDIESLKNAYMSSGFSSKEFDSYFPEYFKLENASGLQKNPKVSNMSIDNVINLMKQAKDDAAASSLSLRKVFEAELMLYAKTRNLNLAKDIIKRAIKLESEVAGVGILDSLFNAMRGNVSETSLMMALLGTPELMREYTEIIAQATGHKLAPVEIFRRDADIAKSLLNNAIIEHGLARGLQNAIESISIRQQAAAAEKALNNLFRNTTAFTGFFRNIYYYLWMGDNIATEASADLIPANPGTKASLFKGSHNSKYRVVTAASSVVLSPPQMEAELKRQFNDSMTNTQRIFNKNYQADASKLIDTIVRLNNARISNNITAFSSLRPTATSILKQKGFKNTHNAAFIELAESYLALLDTNQPITENAVEVAESLSAPETIEQLAPNKEQGEKFKVALQRYDEAKKTYNNIKSSIYGEPGASMIAGNAKELGQTKLVPYKSPEQVKAKISSAQESINSAKAYNKIVQSVLNAWISTPAASFTGKTPDQVQAIKTRLKYNIHTYQVELEKFAADAFELKSEALTIEQTMKQRNERFMGGQLAAELSGLAASSKGTAYGLAGGVSELNRLMDSQIATQEEKIQNLQAALSSAGSPEERMALEGQLKNADIEKELLKNKLFQQTNDALQGKFDPSFYTDAMSSPGISRSSNVKSKFVLASKYIKESDTEIEDYYNDLYEDSEDSPEYGTALEHPKETRYTLTVDIPKHKHKKSSKYKLN